MTITEDFQQQEKVRSEASEEARKRRWREALANLRVLADKDPYSDDNVGWHDGGPAISIRRDLGTKAKAAKVLNEVVADESVEQTYELPPEIIMRPHDGAYAMSTWLREAFGSATVAKGVFTPFGSIPPETITVQTDYIYNMDDPQERGNKMFTVAWGRVDCPPFEGQMHLGMREDSKYGLIFTCSILAAKSYKEDIEAFWAGFAKHAKDHSIYKGKAIEGVGEMVGGDYIAPRFLDAKAIDPKQVSYNQDTQAQLDVDVFGVIRHAQALREEGEDLNQKVLLSGKPGTGKSLTAGLAMRIAVEEGWTVIKCKIEENFERAMRQAEMLAPTLMIAEDADTMMTENPVEMGRLLDLFDGISNKHRDVMLLMTTNYVGELKDTMTRPGRIDAIVTFPETMDTQAITALIKTKFPDPEKISDQIDWERVQQAMQGYPAAFVQRTFKKTRLNAIVRSGSRDYVLTTEDFELAAQSLRAHYQIHAEAPRRKELPTLDQAMEHRVTEAVKQTRVDFQDGGNIVERTPAEV